MTGARWRVVAALWCLGLCATAVASPSPSSWPPLEVALTGHRHDLRIVEGELAGPARPVLDRAFAGAGYVVLAEEHNNRDIPDLSVALFRMLQAAHGFQYFATEQDPLALALLSQDPARGRAGAAADFVRRFPQAMPFVSDQELRMLDEIAGASRARHHPLWGIDQAYGATHYLESLLPLAPDDPLKSEVAALLESARATEARRDGDPARRWLSRAEAADGLLALQARFKARESSDAHALLEALATSRRIYANFHRASAGQPTGLLSNWEREDWMKRRFSESYRRARWVEDQPPGVLVKAGGWHVRRGLGPGHVFTLGSLIHELALFEGRVAVSVDLVPFADPAELGGRPAHAVLAKAADVEACTGWCLLDLRPLRALMQAGAFVDGMDADSWRALHRQVFGYEFVLWMPDSGPASWTLTGMEP